MKDMISAILLGAGFSKRMGKDKLSLPWGKKTILEHCLEILLRSKVNEIVLVLGDRNRKAIGLFRRKNVKIAVNLRSQSGMSTSIRKGIQFIHPGSHGILIALGDQPFLKTRTVNALIRTFNRKKKGILIPSFRGSTGHPVIFHHKFKKALGELKGDEGGKSILAKHPEAVRVVPVKSDGVLRDIDTRQDYEKVKDRHEKKKRN